MCIRDSPFSMPSGGMETLLKAERGEIDPLDILADQYDLVCNGVEPVSYTHLDVYKRQPIT